jgi:hypothetical protein
MLFVGRAYTQHNFIFYGHKERYRKFNCNIKWFYHRVLYTYLYIYVIRVNRHPDYVTVRSGRNTLLKNNMCLKILVFQSVHLLVYHTSIKQSLLH